MAAAVGLVLLGYALMLFENAVSENPVDGFLSLYIAPILLALGYGGVAWAILWTPPEAPPTSEPA